MMEGMRLNGTRVLVEVDDNYLVMPPHKTEWRKTIEDADVYDHHSREAHRRIVESVTDGVIVSTRFLEKQYRKVHGSIFVCPNYVDADDWPELDKAEDGVLRFGWAASSSHLADSPLLVRALRWLAEQRDVELVFIGLQPPMLDDLPAIRTTWTNDLPVFRKLLQLIDVGFAPVKPNHWSLARSDLKVLEYAMAGAMTIASDVDPYHEWRDSPVLLAKNAREFFEHARWCVQHRDEVKRLAQETRDIVLKHRQMKDNVWRWEEAIAS